VVGCYDGAEQVGFARVVSELVREAVDNGPFRDLR
jgi:hypothetical protein